MAPIAHPCLRSTVLGIVLALFALTGQAQPGPSSAAARLIAEADRLNGQCRGGSGDSLKTQEACARREAVHAQIEREGWCWGPKDAAGFEQRWIRCIGDSKNTYTGTPREPRRVGPIGFRWLDDQNVPGVFTIVTITNEPIAANQIDRSSICDGKSAFWGTVAVHYRSDPRPMTYANACWIVDRGQVVLELAQSSGAGRKAGPYRFNVSQFKSSTDPDKGRPLTVNDLPQADR